MTSRQVEPGRSRRLNAFCSGPAAPGSGAALSRANRKFISLFHLESVARDQFTARPLLHVAVDADIPLTHQKLGLSAAAGQPRGLERLRQSDVFAAEGKLSHGHFCVSSGNNARSLRMLASLDII